MQENQNHNFHFPHIIPSQVCRILPILDTKISISFIAKNRLQALTPKKLFLRGELLTNSQGHLYLTCLLLESAKIVEVKKEKKNRPK